MKSITSLSRQILLPFLIITVAMFSLNLNAQELFDGRVYTMPFNTALEVAPTNITLSIQTNGGTVIQQGTTTYNPLNSTNHYDITYASGFVNSVKRLYVDLATTSDDNVQLGCVTVADINGVVQQVLGTGLYTASQRIAADVNIDGEVNIGDAIQIQRVILGLDNQFSNSIVVDGTTHADVIAVYPTTDDLFTLPAAPFVSFSSVYEHQFFPGTIFGRDFAAINLGDLVNTGCGVFNTFHEGDNGEVSLRMENPLILSMKTESLSTTTTRFIISAEDYTTKSLLSIQLSIFDGARIISAKSNNSNVSKNGYSINDDGRSLSLIQLPDLSANESVLVSQDIVSFIVEHPSSVSDLKGIVQLSEISGEDNVYYDYTNKSVTATRGLTLSTKAVATENGLNILASPNPFNGELQISSNLVIQSIRVISMEGKLLSTFNQLNQNSVSLSEMFKGDLPAGNYLIEVTSTNGNRETIKVAKK